MCDYKLSYIEKLMLNLHTNTYIYIYIIDKPRKHDLFICDAATWHPIHK